MARNPTILLWPLMLTIALPQNLAAQAQISGSAPSIPDTIAGLLLQNWLDAFNSPDPEPITAFQRAKVAGPEIPSEIMREFRRVTGGFTLVRIESAGPEKASAVLEEHDWPGAFTRLTIEVDQSTAGKIKPFALQRAAAPAGIPPIQRMSEAEALAALKAKLESISGTSGSLAFSGAIRIARSGKPIFDFVSGQADREKGIANTIDTKFRIGSMNKMMTAVSILQLVDAGKVRLDAPIGTYLTNYPNKDLASRVTIEHLLTHTGGTGDIFGPEFTKHRLKLCEHSDYVALYGGRDVAFPPGERFAYSNYGFLLLGAIVEAVTGQSYYDYVREHIYVPAGMTDSGSLPETSDVPKRAVGYTSMGPTGPRPPGPNTDTLPCRGTAAGGGYSTVGDLIRFSDSLRESKVLGPNLLAQATQAHAPNGSYGYGFIVGNVNSTRRFGHGGGAPGMSAELLVLPELGYSVAIASNTDSQFVMRIAEFLAARLPTTAR